MKTQVKMTATKVKLGAEESKHQVTFAAKILNCLWFLAVTVALSEYLHILYKIQKICKTCRSNEELLL